MRKFSGLCVLSKSKSKLNVRRFCSGIVDVIYCANCKGEII
jgi:hypothetical protein